ncbi:MAG: epoxyqueuosine reductase [Proteobacteria bacterium]|nr:epoxyqueuosine reductase [Pseudomonadota bacterium]
MAEKLKKNILYWLAGQVDATGFASMDRFEQAPEIHHPLQVLEGARSVVVFGRNVPKGILHSPRYAEHLLHRSYHSVYPYLDALALNLANLIERQGFTAVPIGSFAPLVYQGLEPWGVISLKHAAEAAGLGRFGRSGQLYHPEFGSMLRLGAVITSAELPPDPLTDEDPCPEGCTACWKACPVKAFENGEFHKQACLAYSIKHAIYPLALRTEEGLKNIERVINTAGHNYWLTCLSCLKACPNNRMGGR